MHACVYPRVRWGGRARMRRCGTRPEPAPFYVSCTTLLMQAHTSMGNITLIQRAARPVDAEVGSSPCRLSSGRSAFRACIPPILAGSNTSPMSTGCATTAMDLLNVDQVTPVAGTPYYRGLSSAGAVGVAWDSVTLGLRAIIRSIAVVSRPKITGDHIDRQGEAPGL